ncbi:MAG: glycosyltransferase family 2 protein, partial [Thermoproteota archaeon]
MQFPKVSVIVLNYNGKKFIVNCLRSLLLTKYPNFEVLFVDNSST